jgi:transposase
MTRTRHTEKFKREAVKLALESDETYKVISDNLGINYKTLTYWIRASMASNTDKDKDIYYKSRYQQLINENTELKRKLKKTEIEREVLKKATAYFANPNS